MNKNSKEYTENSNEEIMNESPLKIIEHIAVLRKGTGKAGFNKEINIISWFGREPRYDIRSWSPDYTSSRKDVTFSEDEMRILLISLQEHFANK